MSLTAPTVVDAPQTFLVTHPFHPLHGQHIELVGVRHNFDGLTLFFLDANGNKRSIPASHTNVQSPDPLTTFAAGRAFFRAIDLVEMAKLIQDLES